MSATAPTVRRLGPISPEGRLASSRNSLKHGFSGDGKVLPPEMEQALQGEIAVFAAKYQPRDDYERDLIRRAALGNLRARRISEAEFALIDGRTREAVRRWDHDREDAVADLADRLDREPAQAHRLLRRTAHGCDFLGDAWESLGRTLDAFGHWDQAQARRALRLLGLDADPTPASPEPLRDFWLCVYALQFERDPAQVQRTAFPQWTPEQVRRYLPNPAEARASLKGFVRERVAEHEALGTAIWDEFDAPAREAAASRAAFDDGPETAKLHRYRLDAERLRQRALDELARLRRDADRAPEPAAPRPARNDSTRVEPPARNEPDRPAPSADLPASTPLADRVLASLASLDRVETVPLTIATARR